MCLFVFRSIRTGFFECVLSVSICVSVFRGENAPDFFARIAPCNLLASAVVEAFGAEVTGQEGLS